MDVMVRLAERLKVARVPEQAGLAPMRHDVINHGRLRMRSAGAQDATAARPLAAPAIAGQDVGPQVLPGLELIPTPPRGEQRTRRRRGPIDPRRRSWRGPGSASCPQAQTPGNPYGRRTSAARAYPRLSGCPAGIGTPHIVLVRSDWCTGVPVN